MSHITKSATICKAGGPSEDEMGAINAQAIVPLSPDQVFAFRVVMCDTRVDRDFERFSDSALEQMASLFVGKTVVKDHNHRSDNQVARIYEAHVEQMEGYRALVGSAYMLDSPANADLIADIKGGIRREVSVGVGIEHAVCSVCGTDNAEAYCSHFPGREYDGKLCTYELSGVADAYELSFVAVPAQRGAGVSKSYGTETVFERAERAEGEPACAAAADDGREKGLSARLRASEAWTFAHTEEN